MPIAACPDCQQRIPDLAVACVHCGRPVALPAPSYSRGRRNNWGQRLADQETQREMRWESVLGVALLAFGLVKLVFELLE